MRRVNRINIFINKSILSEHHGKDRHGYIKVKILSDYPALEHSPFIGPMYVNHGGGKTPGVLLFLYLVLKLKIGWVAFSDDSRADEIHYQALMSQPNISTPF